MIKHKKNFNDCLNFMREYVDEYSNSYKFDSSMLESDQLQASDPDHDNQASPD